MRTCKKNKEARSEGKNGQRAEKGKGAAANGGAGETGE